MSDRALSAAALVREVADDRLSHGDRTFAYGLVTLLGGGSIAMIGASLLRMAGIV